MQNLNNPFKEAGLTGCETSAKIFFCRGRYLCDYLELDKNFGIWEYLLLEICSKIMFLASNTIYRYPIQVKKVGNFFCSDHFSKGVRSTHELVRFTSDIRQVSAVLGLLGHSNRSAMSLVCIISFSDRK